MHFYRSIIAIVALVVLVACSAEAKRPNIKQQIAARVFANAGTNITIGIIDGISVRFLVDLTSAHRISLILVAQ